MSIFEELRKGYTEEKEDSKEQELTAEEKNLLEAKEDTLSTRAKMRLAYLRAKQGGQASE